MKNHHLPVLMLVVGSLFYTAIAAEQSPASRWDRGSALAAANSVNIDVAVSEIGDPSSLVNGPQTLRNLRALENRSEWPLPAREAAIYRFTQSLASLPRETVDKDVMQHLTTYQAKVLVPHEDHPQNTVPLFNIRGAAAGVENSWLQHESTAEALLLLENNSRVLVSQYLNSGNHAQKTGYLEAIRQADYADVVAVQSLALDQLQESPELTRLVATTTVITADQNAIRGLLVDGRGAGLAPAFTTIGTQLEPSELATQLQFAVENAPAQNATLAIAAWWPALRSDAATRQLLIDKLSDDELGSSVALALAQSPDIQTIHELQAIAGDDSVTAKRAQMALDINRDLLIGEVRK